MIDGKGQDLLDFGEAIDPGHPTGSHQGSCFVNIPDPTRDVITGDPTANPCDPTFTGGYYVNGKDLNQFAFVYDRVNNDIYLLWRAEGAIGDLDGNGNPDNNVCSDPDGTSIPDAPGISGSDKYRADLDFNCNNNWDAGEPSIRVQGSTDSNTPSTQGLTMFFGPEGPGEVPIPIQSFLLAYRAVNGATGHELEAVVHLGTGPGAFHLPAFYRVRAFTGSEDDFLSEESTRFDGCTAALDLTFNSTATPTLLCPNGTTTITLQVHNTSNVAVSDVSVVDDLPAGLSYVANSTDGTCGVGEATVTAQHVAWPAFNLDIDQTCTITFQARKVGPECLGTVTNHSEVTAVFQSPCFNGGVPTGLGPVSSDFPLLCAEGPAVALSLSCSPEGQCEGGPVTVTGIATNTALEAEDITITVAGTTQTFPGIPTSGTATLTVNTTLTQCPSQTFTGMAFGRNECGDSNPTATASCAVTCLACPQGICRITGGGCLNEKGGNSGHKQNTFGGNVSPLHTGGGPTGIEWEHVLRSGNDILFNFHSHDAHITACSVVPPGPCSPPAENTRADFEGTGQYSFGPGGRSGDGNMVAYIIDHGEGKCGGPDYYTITVREGPTIGSGAVVFSIKGELDCGNLQVHETPTSIFKPLPGTPTPDAGTADGNGVMEGNLYRAIPNPFSTAMSYSYRVPAGAEQSVEIGAYDMAGRLVRKLASGAQGAGMYTVRWNGRSDAGEAVAPGVYFVRAQVAGARQVTRVVFLKP